VNAPAPFTATTLATITEVSATEWDRLLGPMDPPMSRWHWLEALEHSGTVSEDRGWRASHLVVRRGGELVAACPLYLRTDTWGEFVWSDPIEEACDAMGVSFGPRAVCTIPATPAAGRRLLTHPSLDRDLGLRVLAEGLVRVLLGRGLASMNVHFCQADEVAALRAAGFLERRQWQYWWRSAGESDFEGFLARLKGKTRRSIRRERRRLAESGVTVRIVPGDEAPDDWFTRHGELYASTADRAEEDQLIESAFFARIGEGPLRSAVRFSAGFDGDELVGLAFEVQGADALFGRTWGLSRPVPYLHFEAAYYASVDHCIAEGLSRFEPGHGGEFKYKRGFEPVRISTMHRFASPRLHAAVAGWAARERSWVEERIAERREEAALRGLPVLEIPQ